MLGQIDHLVVAARTLAEGVAWSELTLGVTPGPGGAHPLMGTHNRLINVSSEAFPQAYLEIIAIDSTQTPMRGYGLRRWFDLDDAALQNSLARRGPQLVHFVERVPHARAALEALAHGPEAGSGIDRGRLIEASRETPSGLLSWQITVRDDGQRLFDGALPTIIQWGPVHPAESMPASGVALRSFHLVHPCAAALSGALGTIGLHDVEVGTGAPNLVAVLETPCGQVTLESRGR